jgi:NAD kinase
MGADRKVVLVTRRTRIEGLIAKYHTLAQARFYLEHLGADFADYAREHETYVAARRQAVELLAQRGRHQALDRDFLPNFLFAPDDIVVALGQDGLVANTMKYLTGQPLVGVNPDPARYDGVLLPFRPADLPAILAEVGADKRSTRTVTMAKAALGDGQVLYAVNDLFIGPRTHVSARYEIALGGTSEAQSSSGIIVATGLGSTAWLKSVVTGAWGIVAGVSGAAHPLAYRPAPWDADYLQFAVREPFPSVASSAGLVFGRVTQTDALHLRSLMAENGVIFSDGIEADRLDFNAGSAATITVAERQGQLVV